MGLTVVCRFERFKCFADPQDMGYQGAHQFVLILSQAYDALESLGPARGFCFLCSEPSF